MIFQQFYHFREITKLIRNIKHEKNIFSFLFSNEFSNSFHVINIEQSNKCIIFENKIRKRIQYIFQRFFQRNAINVFVYIKYENFLFFVVV